MTVDPARAIPYTRTAFSIRALHYRDCIESGNPVQVAAAILAQGGDVPLWKKKYEVIRRLVRMGLSNEEIHLPVSYVDRHSLLKGKQLEEFESHVMKDEKEVAVILTSFEEKGIEKGIEKGKLDDAGKMLAMGLSCRRHQKDHRIAACADRGLEEEGEKIAAE